MSYLNNIHNYVDLLSKFRCKIISPEQFVDEYFLLYKKDLDEMYSVGKERKLELYRKVQQEQMSKEKFIEEMYRLYGITPELEKLLSILGRIFTTCDCFWPDATEEEINPPLVINEEMFRKEIGALSEELQPLIDDYLQEKVDLTNPAKTN